MRSRHPQRIHLSGDLLRAQKIIRIQPLDVISLTERECSISRRGRPLVRLTDHAHLFRSKPLRNGQRFISRPVIDDDELLLGHVCCSADLTVSAIHSPALNAGIRIDTKGFIAGLRPQHHLRYYQGLLRLYRLYPPERPTSTDRGCTLRPLAFLDTHIAPCTGAFHRAAPRPPASPRLRNPNRLRTPDTQAPHALSNRLLRIHDLLHHLLK